MARKFIKDLKEGDLVDEQFSVKMKKPPQNYKAKPGQWFELRVSDATGEIAVKYWGREGEDVQRIYDSFDKGDVVRISGTVSKYKESYSIDVDAFRGGKIVKESIYNIRDFVPVADDIEWLAEDAERMKKEFMEIVGSIEDPDVKKVIDSFFKDPDFWKEFSDAPASMKRHSAFIHGLLHHTLNVAKICDTLSKMYPALDRDIMLGGALLHDIGKLKEFKTTTNIDMTIDGELLGHVFIGGEMVDNRCRELGIDELKRQKLVHIVLTHHGPVENGWGSSKDPALPEAGAVFLADHTDAQVFQYLKLKHEANTDDDWFYARGFGHVFLK